jgi:hypothetical protein
VLNLYAPVEYII